MNNCRRGSRAVPAAFRDVRFRHPDRAQFGGVGAMIEPPGVGSRISPAGSLRRHGIARDRTRQYRRADCGSLETAVVAGVRIVVHPPLTIPGLGVGTQLGLAIAAGLRRFLSLADIPVEELAAAWVEECDRRSAPMVSSMVVSIVDAGKRSGRDTWQTGDPGGIARCWRFVLIVPGWQTGIGGSERGVSILRGCRRCRKK